MSFLLRLCFWLVLLFPALIHAAMLENPSDGNAYSGIGVISGWKCEAEGDLTVSFNGGDPIPLVYGSKRPDVLNEKACDSADVGFVAIWNWANLRDGTHTAVAYDNDVEFARSTFKVTTLGEEFVRGKSPRTRVPDFPVPGKTAHFVWNQGTQHLELDYLSGTALPLSQSPNDLLGTWQFTTTHMDEKHTDNWTLSSIGTTSDVVPLAVGSAESRYSAQGGYIQDVAPDLSCNYDYAVYWSSSLSCDILAFNLTSPVEAEGIRAFAQPDVLRYFYDAHSRQIDRRGKWLALTNAPSASRINDSTKIRDVAKYVWHFTLSYQDAAGVSHERYYDAIAREDYSNRAETDYKKWTIDIGKVRLEWDIVAAEEIPCTNNDGTENPCLAINVRPPARVRNRDGLPFPLPDLDKKIGETMSVVQVIEPYSCGPYLTYSSQNDAMTTGVRTRSPRLVSEAERQDGAALLRAVEAVCE